MAKLLYIKASPMEERSCSHKVAKAFIDNYLSTHPGDILETIDLWETKLPEFDRTAASGKYKIMRGKPHSDEEKNSWQHVVNTIEQFKSADKFLLSAPMWNFAIPYKLKHYIDIIAQPGLTFTYDPSTGYKGLVTGKPVQFVLARGGEYPEGTPFAAYDQQSGYLKAVFAFIGFTSIDIIFVEPTMMQGPEVAEKKISSAIEIAKEKSGKF